MAKFDNVEIGDRLWSSQYGWGTVSEIYNSLHFCIKVTFNECCSEEFTEAFSRDGMVSPYQVFPCLFWNEQKLMSDEEDKKPFNLVEFLGKNLKVKDFVAGEDNFYYWWDSENKHLDESCVTVTERVDVYFNHTSNEILNMLNENKVTIKMLKKAYKTLGWL